MCVLNRDEKLVTSNAILMISYDISIKSRVPDAKALLKKRRIVGIIFAV